MKVAIIGAGYVGLNTAAMLAYLGHEVVCLDVDPKKLEFLRSGRSPIFEPGLDDLLELIAKRKTLYEMSNHVHGKIHFTDQYGEAIPGSSVVFIAVGTPSLPSGAPDLQYLRAAASQIANHLSPDHFTVVVNKSTVPIGSGNWVESLIRDAIPVRDRSADRKFAVASNPEFLREGCALKDSFYADRVVIGTDNSQALEILTQLYRPILEQNFTPPSFLPRPEGLAATPLISTSLASAELIKYSANAFLSLKISFINEIAALSEKVGADIRDISRGIGLDARIGARFLEAGLGWGGSCFGKDTAALIQTGREYGLNMSIVSAARQANYQQRTKIIDYLQQDLKILKGKVVGLLGLAFKPNTDDLRDAPSIDIAKQLLERGVSVRAHDPVAIPRAKVELKELLNSSDAGGLQFSDSIEALAEGADALILVTEWQDYRSVDWNHIASKMREGSRVIIDGRNYLNQGDLRSAGFSYRGIGC